MLADNDEANPVAGRQSDKTILNPPEGDNKNPAGVYRRPFLR
jgi:hypothetical protein